MLLYAGIGAVVGAATAGVGAAVAGAVSSGGFVAGAIIGGASGATSGFLSGIGNPLANRGNISDAFSNGLRQAAIQGSVGALFGGVVGGISANESGRGFWTGEKPPTPISRNFEYPDFKIKRGYGMRYGGGKPKVSTISGVKGVALNDVVIHGISNVPILDNSLQAVNHYLFGKGEAVAIGTNTTNSLMQSTDFQRVHQGVVNGEITQSGKFNVDMTKSVFHIGRTNVSYSINSRSVTYKIYQNDGFWDPDFVDEMFIGKGGFAPDGPGPNLERFGGTPYNYLTTTRIFSF